MTDRLTLARALEDGGIRRDAAEHIATEIFDAVHDHVATKTDLQAVESELKADLQAVESELKADLQAVESELKADVAAVGAEVAALRIELKADIALVEHRLMTRLGGAIAVAVGIILAAIRYLPHG